MRQWNQGETDSAPAAESLQQRLARLRQAMRALEEEVADVAQSASAPASAPSDQAVLHESSVVPAQAAAESAAMMPRQPPAPAGETVPATPPQDASAPNAPAHPAPAANVTQSVKAADVPEAAKTAVEAVEKQESADGSASVAEMSPADRVALLLGRISQPQNMISTTERRLALDALGMLLPRVPEALQDQVVQRLCVMERPPRPLLEAALLSLSDDHVARLLAEAHLSDAFLADIVRTGNVLAQQSVLRRRRLGPATCMGLAETAPAEILAPLLQHENAPLSEGAWRTLLSRAMQEPSLHPLLVRHAALPLPVAHELFWHLGSDLRAALLSRSAGESRLLEELLTVARAPGHLPAREFLEKMEMAFGAILQRDTEGAVVTIASATGMRLHTVRRIFRDEGGEAMAILFKGHQVPGRTFLQTLRDHAQGHLGRRWMWLHEHERLMDLYDGVGIARARLMLLYWDWRSRGDGPYAAYPPLSE